MGSLKVKLFVCLCVCVVVWLCGCVVVWLCGCVVVRLCGCAVVWFVVCLAETTRASSGLPIGMASQGRVYRCEIKLPEFAEADVDDNEQENHDDTLAPMLLKFDLAAVEMSCCNSRLKISAHHSNQLRGAVAVTMEVLGLSPGRGNRDLDSEVITSCLCEHGLRNIFLVEAVVRHHARSISSAELMSWLSADSPKKSQPLYATARAALSGHR